MKRFLIALSLLGACSDPIDLILRPVTETKGPTLTHLELTAQGIGENCGPPLFAEINPALPLPFIQPVRLLDEVRACPVRFEIRLFVGEVEVGRNSATVFPEQTEATLLFTLCSNGAAESLEVCDDANLQDGDGCDSTCRPTGCASGVATVGELCFAPSDDLVGPDNPLQVLAADVDGDELPDLVAPYSSLATPGVVRVFSNLEGNFGAVDSYPLPNVERVALGDIDGDGDLDAVASVHPPNEVLQAVVLANSGGAFSVGVGRQLSTLSISALALGDIDGDGRLDLLYTDQNTARLLVHLGNGEGFGFQNQAATTGPQPIALQLADIDTDGDLDAVTANASGSVSILVNDNGAFSSFGPPLVVGGVPSALVLGDFDTNFGLDLVVAKQENGVGKVKLFRGSENRTFEPIGDFDGPDSPSALVAADLDLDGDLDIATTSQTASLISVQFNNGLGQFDAPKDATGGEFQTRLGPVSLAASDLNGDNVPDLVAAGKNLGLLLSNP